MSLFSVYFKMYYVTVKSWTIGQMDRMHMLHMCVYVCAVVQLEGIESTKYVCMCVPMCCLDSYVNITCMCV